jgi:soluble lytic murein transglycosylase
MNQGLRTIARSAHRLLVTFVVTAAAAGAIGAARAQAQQQQGGVTILRGTPAPPPAADAIPAPSATQRPAPRPVTVNANGPNGQVRPGTPAPRQPVAGGTVLAPGHTAPLTVDSILAGGRKLDDNDAAALKAALVAADENRWEAARALVPRQDAPELAKLVDWLSYRSAKGDGSFHQIVAFLRANPDWPDESALRRQAEDRIGAETPATDVVAFFAAAPPQTSAGVMRRLAATASAAPTKLAAVVRESWRLGTFRPADELEFLNRYRQHLGDGDHIARFDRLVREGRDKPARELLATLPPAYHATAEARLALLTRAPDAVTLLRGLPAERQRDPRIGFEQLRYLRRTGDAVQAAALLRQGTFQAAADEDWWQERQQLARDALQARRAQEAYDLAAAHGLVRGAGFADAEFLAGWIALRQLNKPELAIRHFRTLEQGVSAPISKSRATYWLGRAHEADKKPDQALAWYDRAAQHGHTYYGQLAAKKLPGGFARMPTDPGTSDEERRGVERRELVSVLRYLRQIGEEERARPFLLRLSRQVQTAGEIGLTARLAIELGRPDIAVAIARRAVETGVVLFQTSYPVVDLGDTGAIERALALALARHESSFNVGAVSPSGALGLMQLMPGTARDMARKTNQPFDSGRLTGDPAYNVTLGSQYLSDMLQRFGGSYELALAAYNAGPNATARWLQSIGDPRGGKIDMVDWIEMIPYRETRNYVQRVMEGVAVYRDRLGGSFDTVPLQAAR